MHGKILCQRTNNSAPMIEVELLQYYDYYLLYVPICILTDWHTFPLNE